MSTSIVARGNGHAPTTPITRLLTQAATQVDQLLRLRALIRDAQDAERLATRELIAVMQHQGLRALQGADAVAVLDMRTTLTVDPELFLEAAGPRGLAAVRIHVERAREVLDGATLAAISENTTSPVLRIETRAPAAPGGAA